MNKEGKKCYGDYIPWERKIEWNDLEKKIISMGPDEGVRVKAELVNGEEVKIFVNKTGLEHVTTIVYDNDKERISAYKNGLHAYRALIDQIKEIKEIVLY